MGFAEHIPTVTIELDKPRRIACTNASLRRARQALRGDSDMTETLSVRLWAMLEREDGEALTLEQVEEWIYPGNTDAISTAIVDAFRLGGIDTDAGKAPRKASARKRAR